MYGWSLFSVWFSGALVTLRWLSATPPSAWSALAAVSCLAGAGAFAFIGWKNSPAGLLRWDGQLWYWEDGGPVRPPSRRLLVVADFQRVLLVRLEDAAGHQRWLWAECGAAAERWTALRRAIYSAPRAPLQLAPDGEAPDALLADR